MSRDKVWAVEYLCLDQGDTAPDVSELVNVPKREKGRLELRTREAWDMSVSCIEVSVVLCAFQLHTCSHSACLAISHALPRRPTVSLKGISVPACLRFSVHAGPAA